MQPCLHMGVHGSAISGVVLAQCWVFRVFPLHPWRGGEAFSFLLGADGSSILPVSGALQV
jgi:hypothetical protein